MLNLFRKKETKIEFTDELLERLKLALTEAAEILEKSGHGGQANWLIRILDSANDRNVERFKNLILSNELLGGSGSVIDVWVKDEQQMSRLHELETKLFHLFRETGLKDRALSRLKW